MSIEHAPRTRSHSLPLRRRASRRSRSVGFILAICYLAALLAVVVLQPLLVQWGLLYSPEAQDLLLRNSPPGVAPNGSFHLLGTDQLGRDVLSRLFRAAGFSLAVGALTVLLSVALGVTIGLLAGYFRGWTESLFMRVTDVFMSIPSLLLALFVLYILGGGFLNVALVLALTRWPVVARVTRGLVISLRERQFVESARVSGLTHASIMMRELAPNLVPTIVVLSTLEFTRAMLTESGLSFLGFGIRPPESSWGLMLAQARPYLESAWWLIVFPGLAITITALAVNAMSGRIGMIVDPQLRTHTRARVRVTDRKTTP